MNVRAALRVTVDNLRLIRRSAKFFAALLLFTGGFMLFSAPAAWAFGCEAHETIALIAEKHLTAHAHAMVEKILKDNPIDPALIRYCKQPNLDAMAYSATWADDYRTVHRETGPWHEINIPINVSKGKTSDYCPPESCVTRALPEQIAILRSPDSAPQKRADALRFVIHFVGDLHQPLHTADNNDLGGYCIPITYFGEAPKVLNPQYETYTLNLHLLWDFGILQKALPGETPQQMADELDHAFATQEAKWIRGPVDAEAWTWESVQLAEDIAYGKLSVPVPLEAPIQNTSCSADNHIGTRMLKLNEQVGQSYQDAAAPVLEQQIAKAGARLALILNQIWP